MIWVASSEKNAGNAALEKRLRDATDQFLPILTAKFHSQFQNLLRPRNLLLPRLLLGQVNLKSIEL